MACRLVSFISVTICAVIAQAATITYDFNITWVTTNPDGAYDRPTIGINGQWPLPRMVATVGDRVVVNVINQLENRTSSLHFHGLYMNGSSHMDGPVGVSQCAIPPGSSFTYDFNVRKWSQSISHVLIVTGHPTWDILVSCTQWWPVSRRTERTFDHPWSRESLQKSIRWRIGAYALRLVSWFHARSTCVFH